MVRGLALLLGLLLALLPGKSGLADMQWKQNTPAQQALKSYIERANEFLSGQGEQPVNSLFEMYDQLAVFGITAQPDAQEPEGVEITVRLLYQTMNSLELRVRDATRFPNIAGAFLWALNPGGMTRESALAEPTRKANQAIRNPQTSFEDPVEELNGTRPRIYYAYYPNQYRDGVSWLQMTIIFPLEGTWEDGSVQTVVTETRGPDTYSGNDAAYDGYFSRDDYSHYEFFVTPTPEPDSAAGEEWSMEELEPKE